MAILGAAEHSQVERFVAFDERDTLLRVTWRSARGFVNLSLWRDATCVETFHLSPSEAGRLMAFLATTLTAAVPDPIEAPLRLVGGLAESTDRRPPPALRDRFRRASSHVKRWVSRRPT